MSKVKTSELRTLAKADLQKKLDDLKHELSTLRVAKVAGGAAQKLMQIGEVRKNIARVNTVISHEQRKQLRIYYEGKKYTPLDLRTKKTRAIRRAISKKDLSRKTLKQTKKEMHFPMRKYAVKA